MCRNGAQELSPFLRSRLTLAERVRNAPAPCRGFSRPYPGQFHNVQVSTEGGSASRPAVVKVLARAKLPVRELLDTFLSEDAHVVSEWNPFAGEVLHATPSMYYSWRAHADGLGKQVATKTS